MKNKFLLPFEDTIEVRAQLRLLNLSLESCIKFLQTASEEEIKQIGWGILYIYPDNIRRQFANTRKSGIDYSFRDDLQKEYSLQDRIVSKDKKTGSKLVQLLSNNPNMTAKEFLST